MLNQAIAAVAHDANRSYCERLGDFSHSSWVYAPQWQRDSMINGVAFHIENPEAGDAASHESWMAEKVEAGWVYGETKDVNAKTHPCLMPFDELPPEQQAKDRLVRSIVHALR